ncbi:DUF4267 domain-containing protein [Patulibacter minatonensis]|uniref:DUF4267 domain-containing protein n=1 Tax=Patulibacter minatonensis TaxID=298163 RepID=UPI00047CAC42|nr:DUF4267 domain-containing protein [Patulibacter minatonensis]
MSTDTTEVDTYLKVIAGVRIAYGVASFAAPAVAIALVGVKSTEDSRQTNYFLGSRDIALGIHALVAIRNGTQRDAVLVNQLCEVVDSVIAAQDIARRGRVTAAGAFAVVFNVSQHAAWIRSRLLLKG